MMYRKKVTALVLALCLAVSMTACQEQTAAVYVQSVKDLAGYGGIAPGDRFAGLVVSENVAEVNRDSEKTIEELLVREGDDVTVGQELFSYDTEELQLNYDKKSLELEQLKSSVESYKSQIRQLETERSHVTGSEKLRYTLEIQSTQLNQKEAELKIKTKEKEVEKAAALLENATVVSPVDGRIQAINESGTNKQGEKAAYITIQQMGSYRVKGVLGELQRGAIMTDDRVTLISRIDETEV